MCMFWRKEMLSIQPIIKQPNRFKHKIKQVDLKNLKYVPQRLSTEQNYIPSLCRISSSANFFGVTSAERIKNRFSNQAILTVAKTKEKNFADVLGLNIDNPFRFRIFKPRIKMAELKEKGAARFTINSKLLGKNGKSGFHTVGLVVDKNTNTLFVLDSLAGAGKTVQRYHNLLISELINKDEFSQIIRSTKPQQNFDEFTCNNWAIANIEAVQKALKSGKVINNSSDLNNILPSDINAILEEQQEFVIKHQNEYSHLRRFDIK